MFVPTITGIIDRRVLVNFRVDLETLAKVCPSPFRPQEVNGYGVAGICLIRVKAIRPKRFPSFFGLTSENAAHRIAVEWDTENGVQTGVFVPRRDTSSFLTVFAGGRLFPGVQNRAGFRVQETDTQFSIEMNSRDGKTSVKVNGETTSDLPATSIFESVETCSKFFQNGSLGYSPAHRKGQFDGLELNTFNWNVEPLSVSEVASSFFDDLNCFPTGSVEFDNALLMRGIDHEWIGRDELCCPR